MAWQVLARQEARTSASARSVRVLLALVLLVIVSGGYLFPVLGADPHTTAHFGGFIASWMVTLVPLVGLVIGYNAIVSERTSGSLLLTLSMPYSRSDVVFGKFIGRAAVIAGALLAGLVVAAGLVVYPFGELDVLPFLGFVVLTVGLATVFTGIGIAISTNAKSKQRATVGAFAVYFLFVLVWEELQSGALLLLESVGVVEDELPEVIDFVIALEPATTYERLVAGLIDPSQAVGSSWYLQEWFGLLVFVVWIILPVGLANYRFSEVDL